VYTYYEPNKKKSKEILDEEQRLLLQWRKAWWAQGFKPIVLGRGDALNNPLYAKVQMLRLEDNIEEELERWLAWANMGSGILADTRLFPMAKYDNSLLSFLRRGSYPQMTRYQGLKAGLFCGDKTATTSFIEKAIAHPELKKALNFANPMFTDMFRIESGQDGVAYYDSETLSKLYQPVADPLLGDGELKGLQLLGDLINFHLQTTWQSAFVEVAVLKPLPKFTTTLVRPALQLAGNLTACPPVDTALLGTCPPNRPKCKKCMSTTPIPITTPGAIRNKTDKFYIGTVPHPYTTTALLQTKERLDATVRRQGFKDRDAYLTAVTADSLAGSNEARLAILKSTVAGDWAAPRTFWYTAEQQEDDDGIVGPDPDELPWLFGFRLPHSGADARVAAESVTPVPGPERRPPPPEEKEEGRAPVADNRLETELRVLASARRAVAATSVEVVRRREAVEMWNLGDIEAWRFVKAFGVRRKMVRLNWELEESKFAGAERKGGWGRWLD
jgi:hypothetical protein